MQTKQELLDHMRSLKACPEATDWVTAHASDNAQEIWRSCQEIPWLIWLGGRLNPTAIAGFAKRCADRAKVHAAYAADYAPYAAYAAYAAAAYAARAAAAAYAADYAGYAAAYAAERKLQLGDLQSMWAEVSNG